MIESTAKVWTLIAVNFLGVLLGTVITALSYVAYRSNDQKKSLRNATIGFGLLTGGTTVEPVYQLGIVGTHVLASEQNVPLQIIEATMISTGFLVLFFSIYKYRARTQRITVGGEDLVNEHNEVGYEK